MKIQIRDFVEGARRARGVAIVIDVFRACSLTAWALARGAVAVVPVDTVERARELKRAHPQWLLLGERHARALPGFDAGNSPADLAGLDVAGRTIIHTTHAGTLGIVRASLADEVLAGALVNAAATVRYVREREPPLVTLVRMGHEARVRCAEDDLCAELLASRLRSQPVDVANLRDRLRHAPSARKFFDPACPWAPAQDFELCTAVDCLDFAVRLDCSMVPPSLIRTGSMPA